MISSSRTVTLALCDIAYFPGQRQGPQPTALSFLTARCEGQWGRQGENTHFSQNKAGDAREGSLAGPVRGVRTTSSSRMCLWLKITKLLRSARGFLRAGI